MSTTSKQKPGTAALPRATPALQPARAPWWQRDSVLASAVFVLALAVFANSVPNDYVYDDIFIISTNPHISWPWDLKGIFGTDYWGGRIQNSGLYRPLTILSFAADWTLFGGLSQLAQQLGLLGPAVDFGRDRPVGIHLHNVLLNAAVAVLIYGLVRRLWARKDLALLTAALYAIHPVHTEVVANGVGRAELYMMLLLLAAMHLHLTYATATLEAARPAENSGGRRRSDRAGRGRSRPLACLWGAAALYFLALLFKESAVVLPALIFLMDWLVLRRGRWPSLRQLTPYMVYVLALALCYVLRTAAIGQVPPPPQEVMSHSTTVQRMLFASDTLLRYIGQLTFPLWLCAEYADYAHPVRTAISEPMVLASLVAWVLGAGLVLWLARRRQWLLLFGIAWFFISILPVSNLIQPVGTVRADRLLFLPSLGFVLILAFLLARLGAAQRVVAIAVTLLILGFYTVRSVTRNAEWRDQDTLMARTAAQNPGSAVAWLAVGHGYNLRNDYRQAADAYELAYRLRDSAGFFYTDAHLNRAQMLKAQGDLPGAVNEYRTVLQHNPRQKEALLNLGELIFRDAATRAEAVDLFKRYVAEEPHDFRGHANLAQAYKHARDYAQSLREIDEALRLQPDKGGVEESRLLHVKADILRLSGNLEESERLREVAERLHGGG